MSKIYNYFKNLYDNNMLVQAYIVGNTTYDDIKEELYLVLNSFFFNDNAENNPDVYVLKSDSSSISKDEIKQLLKNISTTSQFNGNKVYIIDGCEKLNDFSCNALLKTLEEPQEGIYAILITNNINSVKPTILSRCQEIFVSSNYSDNTDYSEYKSIGDELIEIIEKNKLLSISRGYNIYSKITDKNELKNIFKYLLIKYYDSLHNMIDNISVENNIILLNNSIIEISKKILVINDNISKMEYNLNKNLSIDRFVIEMWGCKNENSKY